MGAGLIVNCVKVDAMFFSHFTPSFSSISFLIFHIVSAHELMFSKNKIVWLSLHGYILVACYLHTRHVFTTLSRSILNLYPCNDGWTDGFTHFEKISSLTLFLQGGGGDDFCSKSSKHSPHFFVNEENFVCGTLLLVHSSTITIQNIFHIQL